VGVPFCSLLIELLLEAGGFTRSLTHEVKLGASDDAVTFYHNLVDTRGSEQERALDANAVGRHAADCDGLIVTAFTGTDNGTFELLDAFAVTFLDFEVYADIVTGFDLGDIFVLFGFERFDNVCHCLSSLPLNVFFFESDGGL